MFWTEEVFEQAISSFGEGAPFIINDSKTPSGEAHVGSLRGALIHDAVFRVFREKGEKVIFSYGTDDYDPVDEIPKGQDAHFEEKYLGQPLCLVPPPAGSPHPDMATHFISTFFEVFKELCIEPQFYRMRDVYQSGKFDEAIEAILASTQKVRAIYKNVSGSVKNESWYPFQPICESCGKIGTTLTTHFDGKEVSYTCEPKAVTWAKGCGYKGKVSPFGGKGKLPWKLEWVAKWKTFGVTIEGGGMDHTTKGGSRDVSSAVLKSVFGQKPPVCIPYGFFLVDGTKMSSSKGIGATAKEMSAFLPPEILRFLMLRTPPKRAIDFSPSDKYITGLYNEFDSTKNDAFSKTGEDGSLARQVLSVSEPTSKQSNYFVLPFSVLKTLTQLPHVDVWRFSEEQKGSLLSQEEVQKLEGRITSVRYWIKHHASEDDIFTLQKKLHPNFYDKASSLQCGFLHKLHEDLSQTHKLQTAEDFQNQLFTSARLTPIPSKDAFKAIYLAFLNKDKGPVAGSLLFHLDRNFVLERLGEISVEQTSFLAQSASSKEELLRVLSKEKDSLQSISVQPEPHSLAVTMNPANGKVKLVRLLTPSPDKEAHILKKEIIDMMPTNVHVF